MTSNLHNRDHVQFNAAATIESTVIHSYVNSCQLSIFGAQNDVILKLVVFVGAETITTQLKCILNANFENKTRTMLHLFTFLRGRHEI